MTIKQFDSQETRTMTSFLNKFVKDYRGERYVQALFDPTQTHGLYGIHADQVDEFKAKLKEIGATRFRVVKASGTFRILCFSAKKIVQ